MKLATDLRKYVLYLNEKWFLCNNLLDNRNYLFKWKIISKLCVYSDVLSLSYCLLYWIESNWEY